MVPWTGEGWRIHPQPGIASGRNHYLGRELGGASLNGRVGLPGVIRPVSGQRGERPRYLLQETGDLRTITRPMRRELRCEELTGLRIDGQMQLTPPPPVLFLSGFVPAVDPEPRAIHQNLNLTTVSGVGA